MKRRERQRPSPFHFSLCWELRNLFVIIGNIGCLSLVCEGRGERSKGENKELLAKELLTSSRTALAQSWLGENNLIAAGSRC